jgi:acetyl-CoA synthetase
MVETLKEHVVKKIGALARPEQILFAGEPKTLRRRIMRRLLRDIYEEEAG